MACLATKPPPGSAITRSARSRPLRRSRQTSRRTAEAGGTVADHADLPVDDQPPPERPARPGDAHPPGTPTTYPPTSTLRLPFSLVKYGSTTTPPSSRGAGRVSPSSRSAPSLPDLTTPSSSMATRRSHTPEPSAPTSILAVNRSPRDLGRHDQLALRLLPRAQHQGHGLVRADPGQRGDAHHHQPVAVPAQPGQPPPHGRALDVGQPDQPVDVAERGQPLPVGAAQPLVDAGGEPLVADAGHRLRDVLALDVPRRQERRAELREGVQLEVPQQEVVAQRSGRDVLGHELDRPADHGEPGDRVAAVRTLHDAAAVGPGDQVVAVVVGDHGDRLGVAVGVHAEVDVLADQQPLAEPDVVPLQQLPADTA